MSTPSQPPYDLHTQAKTLTGWGRTQPSTAQVLSASNPEEIIRAVSMVAEDNETKPSYLKRGVIDAGTRTPDLIILDLGLPDGDGVDLTGHQRLLGL